MFSMSGVDFLALDRHPESMNFVSAAMTDARPILSSRDRLELLCWLTCGNLGAYYLNESWPDASFEVQAAHRWLDRHHRHADWLTIAKLSAIAQDIAKRHAGFVDASWARDAVEEIVDTDDLNYEAKLVQWVFDDCCKALADNRLAD
ncbi:conserved protein of unknown function [Burkholderia multivorans]